MYQECPSCGVLKFFDASNMCDAERNPNYQVNVRKYENIPQCDGQEECS